MKDEHYNPEHYIDDEDYGDMPDPKPAPESEDVILVCFHEDHFHYWIPSKTEHYDIDCPYDGSIRIDDVIGMVSLIDHPTQCPIDKHLNKLHKSNDDLND